MNVLMIYNKKEKNIYSQITYSNILKINIAVYNIIIIICKIGYLLIVFNTCILYYYISSPCFLASIDNIYSSEELI